MNRVMERKQEKVIWLLDNWDDFEQFWRAAEPKGVRLFTENRNLTLHPSLSIAPKASEGPE